jgi:hypothetical protein
MIGAAVMLVMPLLSCNDPQAASVERWVDPMTAALTLTGNGSLLSAAASSHAEEAASRCTTCDMVFHDTRGILHAV